MPDQVVVRDWMPGRRLWLQTPGRYSMDAAVAILTWLESQEECSISDGGWRSAGFGNLVEVGIVVVFGSIEFSVMSSYEDLFVERVAGNNRQFSALCETIQRRFAAG